MNGRENDGVEGSELNENLDGTESKLKCIIWPIYI
jgi:hypothetical protein